MNTETITIQPTAANFAFLTSLDLHLGIPGLKSEFCVVSRATLKKLIDCDFEQARATLHEHSQAEIDANFELLQPLQQIQRIRFGLEWNPQLDAAVFNDMAVFVSTALKDNYILVATNQGTKTFEIETTQKESN